MLFRSQQNQEAYQSNNEKWINEDQSLLPVKTSDCCYERITVKTNKNVIEFWSKLWPSLSFLAEAVLLVLEFVASCIQINCSGLWKKTSPTVSQILHHTSQGDEVLYCRAVFESRLTSIINIIILICKMV